MDYTEDKLEQSPNSAVAWFADYSDSDLAKTYFNALRLRDNTVSIFLELEMRRRDLL